MDRRGVLFGLMGLVAAPAIVRASSLMSVKVLMPMEDGIGANWRMELVNGRWAFTPPGKIMKFIDNPILRGDGSVWTKDGVLAQPSPMADFIHPLGSRK